MNTYRNKYLGDTAAALHNVKQGLLIKTTSSHKGSIEYNHLAVIGNGLLVFVNYVFRAKAVLSPPNLSAGIWIDAISGEGTCKPRERKEIIFCFFRLVSLLF